MKIFKYVAVLAMVIVVVLTINYQMPGNNTLIASTVLTVKEMKSLSGGIEYNKK